ncbi:hypothetical protein [Orientia tsutsugamushi]|uniref:Uncharacterized protein n=1 Tax=Orientia tsutsugamushi TaxID=784 RepID=A0A2U3RQD8_ORITS|nr:hypothetical protein [Orientia tsutsugamushi]KJV55034.1 hypothetical protein OTSKARP_0898 [Orientia tsutsugamushi str. Karp]SPR15387.1 Uncharacterised protein [Orientia tsutsugamushi]
MKNLFLQNISQVLGQGIQTVEGLMKNNLLEDSKELLQDICKSMKDGYDNIDGIWNTGESTQVRCLVDTAITVGGIAVHCLGKCQKFCRKHPEVLAAPGGSAKAVLVAAIVSAVVSACFKCIKALYDLVSSKLEQHSSMEEAATAACENYNELLNQDKMAEYMSETSATAQSALSELKNKLSEIAQKAIRTVDMQKLNTLGEEVKQEITEEVKSIAKAAVNELQNLVEEAVDKYSTAALSVQLSQQQSFAAKVDHFRQSSHSDKEKNSKGGGSGAQGFSL